MNWDDFRFFLAVARTHSLKKPANILKVDQATVGRRLKVLQEILGTQLLEKRSNGYFLTAAGDRILQSIEEAENAMLAAERLIAGKDDRVEGTVRLAMPGALANQWIIQILHPLLQKYPDLEIQFLTGAEVLNLSRREADIAIRLVRPEQTDLRTRKIGTVTLALYISRSIKIKSDLVQHSFIGLYDSVTSELERGFLKRLGFSPHYRVRSSAWSSVYAAVRAGLGIGILPTFIGQHDSSLKVLMTDVTTTPLWMVVHPEVAKNARVRTVIEFLGEVLRD